MRAKDVQGRVGEQLQEIKRPSQKIGIATASKGSIKLTLSQSKKKKGDEVADYEDDDDVVRTSVLQDQMRATLFTEELSSALSIYSYPYISDG